MVLNIFAEKKGRVLSDKLLRKLLSSLKNVVPKNNTKNGDKDERNISVAKTEWDEIGISPNLLDSNDNNNNETDNNIAINKPIDTIGVDATIDADVLINNDLDDNG